MMAGNPIVENPLFAAEGLANLAHAIRRCTALYVAMQTTPEGSTEEEMLATADRLASWCRGKAVGSDPARMPPGEEGFLGVNPWA